MSSTPLPFTSAIGARAELRADCSNCFALCCTALGFSRSADFAEDKAVGAPCRHLGSDHSCTVHDSLRSRGFRGCTVFDCFGAGQAVSQRLFGGVGWRDRPDTRQSMFAAFTTVKLLHEMLWYLAEVGERTYDPDHADEARSVTNTITTLTASGPEEVLSADVENLHLTVRVLLMDVSAEIRSRYFAEGDRRDRRLTPGADLAEIDLRGLPLCGADLRGACLIAADLRHCDVTGVDLLGADLRDVRVEGTDLSGALFLTQSQVNSAQGDDRTRLPAGIERPRHWNAE